MRTGSAELSFLYISAFGESVKDELRVLQEFASKLSKKRLEGRLTQTSKRRCRPGWNSSSTGTFWFDLALTPFILISLFIFSAKMANPQCEQAGLLAVLAMVFIDSIALSRILG